MRTLEAVAHPAPPPGDDGEWRALATTIAVNFAQDERKKARRRQKLGHVGPCEDADVFEPHLTDRMREHYSTVGAGEQRESIARMLSQAGVAPTGALPRSAPSSAPDRSRLD